MAEKTYVLKADELHQPTNKDGEPFTFKTYRKGDEVTFDEARGAELVAAGALEDPDAGEVRDSDGKLAQSKAPGENEDPSGTAGKVPAGSGSEVPALTAEQVAELKGAELDAALKARSLDGSGNEKAKRDRLAASLTA